jgi:hypothetical protein
MSTFTKGKNIQIAMTNINSGGSGYQITQYEWILNGTTQSNNSGTLSLSTNNLNVGNNTLTMRIQNNCGTWSTTQTEIITVTEPVSVVASITVQLSKSTVTVGETITVKATAYSSTGNIIPKVSIQWLWIPNDVVSIIPNVYIDTDIVSTLTALKPGTCQVKAITNTGIFGSATVTVAGVVVPNCGFKAI